MKVKALKTFKQAGLMPYDPQISFVEGEEIEVCDEIGQRVIERKQAEAVKSKREPAKKAEEQPAKKAEKKSAKKAEKKADEKADKK